MPSAKPSAALTKSQGELLGYLFDSQQSQLAANLTTWIISSPRYARFVAKYKDKIRKKVRTSHGTAAQTDLQFELQIPYWLLHDSRFDLQCEPYASGKTRGPDFSVTYRTNFTFNVEVTHMRRLTVTQTGDSLIDFRLVDTICSKLRQMQPRNANLLFIASNAAILDALDLSTHIAWIKEKAESSEPQFYARYKFSTPSDFFKHFERLSGTSLFSSGIAGNTFWLNPQARIKIPSPLLTVLRSLALELS
jgi:hypothetical protein